MDNKESRKVLAVDWGAKRIGLAISDPTGVPNELGWRSAIQQENSRGHWR